MCKTCGCSQPDDKVKPESDSNEVTPVVTDEQEKEEKKDK